MSSHSYPVMLQVNGMRAVIVGGGQVAERKTLVLLEAGASVLIVSPKLTDRLHAWVEEGRVSWRAKLFDPQDLQNAFLIFAATNQSDVNLRVYEAMKPGQLITIADRPDISSFSNPAHVRRGKLLLTVSTDGASPGLSRKIACELADTYDEAYEMYVEFLSEARQIIQQHTQSLAQRRRMLKALLADDFLRDAREGRADQLWERFQRIMEEEGCDPS
ncbi:precorrin-2 dehydrogenase/sirohydrochlorin ferrochelatase family protein [Aneurinibacillus sp. REN35]|uniref:precorrin-2 dehydrogenase/sirohydrochlorin ferrochelatase family protein n=1 Tax=Aneurinibacillus sp. REN35 TaxID=3237286 RepID=UPI0035293E37